jgi:hypothetical protein
MGKTLQYVSEFTFPSEKGFTGSAGKAMDKGYARGGAADMKPMPARKQYPVDRREPMIAMANGGMTKLGQIPASPAPKSDMLYSKKENTAKTLLADGKGAPMPHAKGSVNMKRGGMAMGGMSKVGKVMGEYKAGDLHSGSKSGPVVKSRKQAVAIGMSEARKAAKK